jgi:hypothetical protein
VFPRRVRITSGLDSNWKEVLEDVALKAIPIKYISSVDVYLSNNSTITIDVAKKINTDWKGNLEEASSELEKIIEDFNSHSGISLVEYLLDFDMIRSEVSFTSSRLGNDNNSNND